MIRSSSALVVVLFVMGCAAESPPPKQENTSSTSAAVEDGKRKVGETCSEDLDCKSGICWNAMEHQAYYPWCSGRVCSIMCEYDDECIKAAEKAGAPHPEQAHCNIAEDHQCDFFSTGLPGFGCE